MHVEQSVSRAIDLMVKAQVQANPQLGQFEDLLRAFLAKYVTWDALRDDYAKLSVDIFSEAEIKQLTSFYRTPADAGCLRRARSCRLSWSSPFSSKGRP
jgi:hypothetical protein